MDVTMVYSLCTLTHLFCTIHVLKWKVEKNLQLQLRQPGTIPSYLTCCTFRKGTVRHSAGTSLCCLYGLIMPAVQTNSHHTPQICKQEPNQFLLWETLGPSLYGLGETD